MRGSTPAFRLFMSRFHVDHDTKPQGNFGCPDAMLDGDGLALSRYVRISTPWLD